MSTEEEKWLRAAHRDDALHRAVLDYERRMASRWGRFLLWLLRVTT